MSYHTHVHIAVHAHIRVLYHGERPWEWEGRVGGVPPICPGIGLQMVPFSKLLPCTPSLRLIFPGFSFKSRG